MKFKGVTFPYFFAVSLGVLLGLTGFQAQSQTLGADFVGPYSIRDLGAPSDVPRWLGAIAFKAGESNTFLVGGEANGSSAKIYALQVERGADGHIARFIGNSTAFAEARGLDAGGIDGGLEYGPGGVLFYTAYDDNCLGQLKPGSSIPDKKINLSDFGVIGSVGGLTFVPEGLPGAGRLKLTPYSGYRWYDTTLSPDGSGTYNVAAPVKFVDFDNKPEGIFFVKAGSARFANPSVLIGFYNRDLVSAFEVDTNGDPIVATARDFITGLNGITGAARDPATGDFLFSSFNDPHIYIVGGFSTAPAQVKIVFPTEGQAFTQPATFDIEATASQSGGSIARVEFYSGQQSLETALVPPYRVSASSWPSGRYSVFAVAYDGSGIAYTSAVVHVTVQNSPIQVVLSGPTNGTVLPSCSAVLFNAQVTGGGSITNVTFFAGAAEMGHVTTYPYYYRHSHFSEGAYSVYAVANDDAGAFGTSAPRSFAILPLGTNILVGTQVNDNEFLLCFKGPPGSNCVWEIKNDISKPWRTFATNQSARGFWEYTNAIPPATPAAFYRASIER